MARWEAGTHPPTLGRLIQLSELLKVSLDVLIAGRQAARRLSREQKQAARVSLNQLARLLELQNRNE